MNKKINVLVINNDTMGGVGFFRCTQPHIQLGKQFSEDFNINIENTTDFENIEKYLMYDIVHFQKGSFYNQEAFYNLLKVCKENGVITIIDIDDYWRLGSHHPQHLMVQKQKDDEKIKKSLQLCDYVTTTTQFFANRIKAFNKNVKIFPNAIDPTDEHFIVNKKPCSKLRIGMVMGSSHLYDLYTMDRFTSKLSKEILNKVVFVLCGFDTRGIVSNINPKTGEITKRKMKPEETVWFQYEKMITNDYKLVSPMYKSFLNNFIPNSEFPYAIEEGYKRRWTLPMDKYYSHYEDVDVLFAPLEENEFNSFKSELKMIECAFSHTAFVGSNFGPYTINSRNIIQKGGTIDETGNAILIDQSRAHKDWAKTVERLVNHPEIVKLLQDNLYNDYKEKYDLRNVTIDRANFYKEITKK